MKFGIIKERKNPPDRRVVFSPDELAKLKQVYHDASVEVESSDIRIFTDSEYKNMGIGKKLIEYSRNYLSADYIWGMQDKRFNNLNDWLKRRKLYYTGEFFYITYEIL